MTTNVDYALAETLLASFAIPLVDGTLIWTLGEAQTWTAAKGFPVCLKINSPTIAHRTDVGGVITDIATPGELAESFAQLANRTDLTSDGFLLQRMVPRGVELIVGVKRDPIFGHVITLGVGGLFTELLGRVAIRPLPLDDEDIEAMIAQIDSDGLLDGFRHLPAVDRNVLGDLLQNVSRMVSRHPWIEEMDLNPVICSEKQLWAVDILMTRSDGDEQAIRPSLLAPSTMVPFFRPRSVAVIGASRNPAKGGHVIVKNLRTYAFPGQVVPINPNTSEILGYPCYADLGSVPFDVELAIIIVPRSQVEDAVKACIAKQVKAVIIVTAGFSDTGELGANAERAIAKTLLEAGIRLMGPNSIGTISPQSGLATSITTLYRLKPGTVAIVGQTGVFASGLANQIATQESFGISRVACIGNRADVDECDVLEFLLDDDQTEIIGMYLEGIRNGARFMTLLERARNDKPIVVVKAGRSEPGVKAVSSHTGALAVDDRVFDGICDKYSVMRTTDVALMADVLEFLALGRRRPARRLGAVSISGMGCVLTADLAPSMGFELKPFAAATVGRVRSFLPDWAPLNNPIDLWSTIETRGPEDAYLNVGQAVLDDPAIDALFLIFLLIDESWFDPGPMAQQLLANSSGKPIFAAIIGGDREVVQAWRTTLEEHGVPTYFSIERALRVAGLALRSSVNRAESNP